MPFIYKAIFLCLVTSLYSGKLILEIVEVEGGRDRLQNTKILLKIKDGYKYTV